MRAVRIQFTDSQAAAQAAGGSVVIGTDLSGALATPTSAAQVFVLTRARVFNADQTTARAISYSALAQDLEDMDFTPVGTTSISFQVLYAIAGPVTTPIATLYVEWDVEFRGSQ